jgi:type I restriction-modification system DNA methylase subunit
MASSALGKIQKLLEKYAEVVEEGRVSKYNEEMTKKDFILPLFDALGWKTADSREVTAEEKISKKRVDYGFRINGIPKFFLEAKSLKEDLDNPKFFEQAVSYAWHKGCTWAVLTNFDRVKILNAEWKARNYLQSHFMTLEHWEFIKKFEDLSLLSRESFEEDKLDKLAERYGKKSKKESVDKQLLADFTRFRDILSRSITKLNADKNLSEEELDESVQRILDRLIFIRNCEDRELEPKNLISNYRQWTSRGKGKLVKSLRDDFAYFDEQYNSKLFAEHLCDSLEIDNEILEDVIVGLYYTKDRAISYDFSIIDADVLGTIYEQYLGYILKKTDKRAKITKSRLHRKEHGIYYTPTYVVDYIVKNTLGELIKNEKINVEKIRILDPACGSGSFLIRAFDLLNKHYQKNNAEYAQTQLDLKTDVLFKVKSRILRNNIFGVDLDKKAVEITQLNLLLKIAEKGYRLPLLEKNIRFGNSLIDDVTIAGTKAFNWNMVFKEIIQDGGFDVVIGNPPYGSELLRSEFDYLKRRFISAEYKIDTFALFIEKALDLMKNGGYFGFIIPNTILTNNYFKKIRTKILNECCIVSLIEFSYYVFQDAKIDSLVIVLKKEHNKRKRDKNEVMYAKIEKQPGNLLEVPNGRQIPQSMFLAERHAAFNVSKKYNGLLSGIAKKKDVVRLGSLVNINLGFRVRRNEELVHMTKQKGDVPILHGRDISRYGVDFQGRYFTYRREDIVGGCSKREVYEAKEKLLIQAIRNIKLKRRIVSAYDDSQFFVIGGLLSVTKKKPQVNLKYILALLNSKLLNYIFKSTSIDKNIKVIFLQQLPIVLNPKQQNEVVGLVDEMLSLRKRLEQIGDKKTDERRSIEEQISLVDSKIDDLVYKIYGITDAEKEIIENSLK